MMSKDIINEIQYFWNNKDSILSDPDKRTSALENVHEVLRLLNSGAERACYKDGEKWVPNLWVKQAILLLFFLSQNSVSVSVNSLYCDKVPARYTSEEDKALLLDRGIRIVPGSHIRTGVFIGAGAVIMPSFINIGSYIGSGVMIDSMVTVGSCAHIGDRCHISSGVTIGGVLEPLNDSPVVVEAGCFIGAGSQILEGVVVSQGSILGAGTVITKSTKIYNAQTNEISYGMVPPNSVVIPGSVPLSSNPCVSVKCAVIIKTVDYSSSQKVSINEILREYV